MYISRKLISETKPELKFRHLHMECRYLKQYLISYIECLPCMYFCILGNCLAILLENFLNFSLDRWYDSISKLLRVNCGMSKWNKNTFFFSATSSVLSLEKWNLSLILLHFVTDSANDAIFCQCHRLSGKCWSLCTASVFHIKFNCILHFTSKNIKSRSRHSLCGNCLPVVSLALCYNLEVWYQMYDFFSSLEFSTYKISLEYRDKYRDFQKR